MTRRIAAIVFVLALTPAVLHAQTPVFTVSVQSADVYKGPSTVTPVIGHAARGAALPVSRNLGSWVRIAWPSAPDGFGYVHVTMGRLSGARTEPSAAPTRSPSTASPRTEPVSTSTQVSTPTRTHTAETGVAVQGAQGTTTISHVLGLGALVQSRNSFGATGRAWRTDRVGLDFRLARNAMTSDTAAGRVTSVEFEPRVVYAVFDHVSDYFWVRPYVGSGVNFAHQTWNASSPDTTTKSSNNTVAFRAFGGTELTFAGATRLGLSAELGYRTPSTPFPGFETDRVSLSIAGHWYIK
jgi:hypothetical protein